MVTAMVAVKLTSAEAAEFQVTEIGMIPSDWKLQYVDDFCKVSTGGRNTQDRVADGEYPFFVRSQTIENIDRFSYDEEAILTAGDGVGTGKVFHYISGKYDAHQRVYRMFDFSDEVSGKYFFRYFSENFYTRIMQMTAKSSVDSVRRDMITRMPIALPILRSEQEAIAESLSDADAFIESLEQLIAKKREIKQGAMQELLSGQRRLEGFTDEWLKKSFDEIFDFLPTATNSRSDLREDEGAYYVHYGDIHTRFHSHLDFRSQQPSRIERSKCKNAALIRNGDWIMADASEDLAGVGKSIEIAGLGNGDQAVSGLHTFLLREKQPTFVQGFKGHLGNLKSLHGQYMRVMTGMKVFGVSKTALKNLMLPVPSEKEQREITAILNDMEADIQEIETKVEKVRHCKQGMMQELLTGRIRLV